MNTQNLIPEFLMQKAENAYSAACLLLESGHPDDAANRAYYSMFDAARAALLTLPAVASGEINIGKTHGGLLSAFSKHVVNAGIVQENMIKIIARAQRARQIADQVCTTSPALQGGEG